MLVLGLSLWEEPGLALSSFKQCPISSAINAAAFLLVIINMTSQWHELQDLCLIIKSEQHYCSSARHLPSIPFRSQMFSMGYHLFLFVFCKKSLKKPKTNKTNRREHMTRIQIVAIRGQFTLTQGVMSWIVSPQNSYVEVPTPSTSKSSCIWRCNP